MNHNIKFLKEDDRGRVYETESFKIFYRNKNSVSGDNSENAQEIIYFIKGAAEITLRDEVYTIDSLSMVEFPENTYHKIKALTDIIFILHENNSS